MGTRTRQSAYPDHMAPRVTTVLTAARAGSRVVRYLIRPAGQSARPGLRAPDPWLAPQPPAHPLRRGANLARRALGLGVLLVLSVLGALLLVPLLAVLGIGTASGSHLAAWFLGFTLLLGLFGTVWTFRRASRIITVPREPEAAPPDGTAPTADDEAGLLALWRAGERALPAASRTALRDTVLATREALRATADDASLGRDAFDARQAAREDLPDLLRTYRAAPLSAATDDLFLGQLRLIERRMQGIAHDRQAQQTRALEAQRRYLESKYGEEEE